MYYLQHINQNSDFCKFLKFKVNNLKISYIVYLTLGFCQCILPTYIAYSAI